MKTLGLLGGMSWESTLEYYRIINETFKHRLGKLHSGKILLYSFDFEEIEQLQHQGRWDELAHLLADMAQRLEKAGADILLICTNTMHKLSDEVQQSIQVPLLHIADGTAQVILAKGYKRVGLLGTQFTMEQDFYRGRLQEKYDIEVMVPGLSDRQTVHGVIYQELCQGKFRPESRQQFQAIMADLVAQGAEAIILGCTEIPLLVGAEDSPVPLLNTMVIHAEAAVDFALL